LRGKAVACAVLAATVALAAGCGGGSQPRTATRTSAAAAPKCTLSAKQRRVIRRAKRMIVRMHKLEAPLKTVHQEGPMALELLLNRFLLSIGVLPVDERALLIRKAKSAVGLCHDCFDALEAMEPAVQTKLGESPCKSGF
jgi:hypothetical protein